REPPTTQIYTRSLHDALPISGLIAPDEITFAYLKGRRFAPQGEAWEGAVERWRALRTDPGARFDRVVAIDADAVEPMITYGTHRSEEHTSELQSRENLVCRLL